MFLRKNRMGRVKKTVGRDGKLYYFQNGKRVAKPKRGGAKPIFQWFFHGGRSYKFDEGDNDFLNQQFMINGPKIDFEMKIHGQHYEMSLNNNGTGTQKNKKSKKVRKLTSQRLIYPDINDIEGYHRVPIQYYTTYTAVQIPPANKPKLSYYTVNVPKEKRPSWDGGHETNIFYNAVVPKGPIKGVVINAYGAGIVLELTEKRIYQLQENVFAAQGYAVFILNIRGTNISKKQKNASIKSAGIFSMAKDLAYMANLIRFGKLKAIEDGTINPNVVGVPIFFFGGSFGGSLGSIIATESGGEIVFDPRYNPVNKKHVIKVSESFDGFMLHAPVTDMDKQEHSLKTHGFTGLEVTNWFTSTFRTEKIGSRKLSPILNVGNVTRPICITAGYEDRNVDSLINSVPFIEALISNGKCCSAYFDRLGHYDIYEGTGINGFLSFGKLGELYINKYKRILLYRLKFMEHVISKRSFCCIDISFVQAVTTKILKISQKYISKRIASLMLPPTATKKHIEDFEIYVNKFFDAMEVGSVGYLRNDYQHFFNIFNPFFVNFYGQNYDPNIEFEKFTNIFDGQRQIAIDHTEHNNDFMACPRL